MDASNIFCVGAQGDQILVLNPPRRPMSKEEALMFAAWLVVLTFASDDEFKKYLDAVRST